MTRTDYERQASTFRLIPKSKGSGRSTGSNAMRERGGRCTTVDPNRTRSVVSGPAVAVAAVVLLVPVSLFAGALQPHTKVPPYRGTTVSMSRSVSSYGNCATSASLTGFSWLPKTGNVTGFASASGRGCATSPTGNGSATAYNDGGVVQVAIPIHVYTNSGHNFSVNFSYSYTATTTSTGAGVCPVAKTVPGTYTYSYCEKYVAAGSSRWIELFDQTNGSYLDGPRSYVQGPWNYSDQYNGSYCNGGGSCYTYSGNQSCRNSTYWVCAPSGSMATGTSTVWLNTGSNCLYVRHGCFYNWTLNSTHKFWVLAFVDFYAEVSIQGWGGGRVFASVNGATLGNTGWRITSVTVT